MDNEPVKHKNPETVAHYRKQEHLHSAAAEVGMGVLCIASAYVLWRRKAA